MLHRVTLVALVALTSFSAPLIGQIRPGARISTTRVNNAPKLLVANPTANTADSLAAVTIGSSMRERLSRGIGSDFVVLTREQMNDALTTYGYPVDAILPLNAARQLAGQLTAPTMVSSTLSKSPDGQYMIIARAAATNDNYAGYVATLNQAPGQSLSDFGQKAADALVPAVRVWDDAKECIDQMASSKSKAADAANKAIKTVPNHGLAELCLALLARDAGNKADEARHLEAAAKGDPQSLVAWSALGVIAQENNDSARTVEIYQRMLAVAPTNQVLREEAYKLFNRYNRPEAAMQVVDKGLEIDPANPDLYDLRSNICLGKEDYPCAIAALEQVYSLDSAKADTMYYAKILFAASQRPDTAKYLEWARRGAQKYPDNASILEGLARAYGVAGFTDSSVVITRRLIQIDPTNVGAVNQVVKAMTESGQARQALEFAPLIKASNDPDAADNFAGLVLVAAQGVANATTKDWALLVDLAEGALAGGTTSQERIVTANFMLGYGAYFQVADLSNAVRAQKSREMARREQVLVDKAVPALEIASGSTNAQLAATAKQLLGPMQQERAAMPALIQSFCR
jgi:tetratricopeptide (TPR) repeat protein